MDDQAVTAQSTVTDTNETISFESLRFGQVTVEASKVLEFSRGLVGMPEARRFVFLHNDDGAGPFFWLHSVEDPALAFVVTEPQHFFPDYRVPMSSEEQKILGMQSAEHGVVCLILVVPDDPKKITANLRGPVIVNIDLHRGIQLVLAGDEFSTKEPYLPRRPLSHKALVLLKEETEVPHARPDSLHQ